MRSYHRNKSFGKDYGIKWNRSITWLRTFWKWDRLDSTWRWWKNGRCLCVTGINNESLLNFILQFPAKLERNQSIWMCEWMWMMKFQSGRFTSKIARNSMKIDIWLRHELTVKSLSFIRSTTTKIERKRINSEVCIYKW